MSIKQIIIAILFVTSGLFYYNLTDTTTNLQTTKVTQIIDGDTIKLQNSQTLRLLGINTPEKNMPYYQEAKQFLINLIQNKSIQIEPHGTGKYGRTLAYIFIDNKNINRELLSQGLATLYYYDKDSHYNKLKLSEEQARLNQIGLWKKSPNFGCLKILKFKTDEPEILILQNLCDEILDITYKDDATHIYRVTLQPNSQHTKTFSHIWNTDGDSIYIHDNEGLLLFHRYQ
ncbi:thermonuclease family protein [Candidatus Pacearchaeota archaeon]|nr:thermonuclease family protein [Candidatus Pacearchaeota archaeon]